MHQVKFDLDQKITGEKVLSSENRTVWPHMFDYARL